MANEKSGVTVTLDRTEEFYKAIETLAQKQVLVGIPAGSTRSGDAINNAALAYIHENGSPARNIPARPFLKPAVNGMKDQAVAMLKKAAAFEMDRKPEDANNALNALGIAAVIAVKNKIIEGPFAPLSPRTIAARHARGHMSEKPLIDTGQLLNSITYVIRTKG